MADSGDEAAAPPLDADAEVPHRVDSIPAARAFLTQLLHGWDVSDQVIDDASLLTTELMSNAVEHGTGVVHLEISVHDGLLRIGVHDDAVELPVKREVDDSRVGGRGIWLVQSIAHDWGSDSSGAAPGKTVWFELTTLRSPSDWTAEGS
jgi:anti-sigma regulatory factor (Ser/Thr protein kinase)